MIGYTTEAALTAYAAARGVTIKGAPAALLTRALDYLESLNYAGKRTEDDQPLKWPRTGVRIDGVLLDSESVPPQILAAQHAVALSIDDGFDPLSPVKRAVKRKKADVVEIEYQEGAAPVDYSRSINAALAGLLSDGGGALSFRVTR